MKKYSFCLFLPVILIATLFLGCKTLPTAAVQKEVDALKLLDGNSAFYIKIPAAVDRDLVSRMVLSSVKEISENEAEQIAGRVNTVYAGLTRKFSKSEIQISASCDVPEIFLPRIFSVKNGWKLRKLSFSEKMPANVYTVYNNGSLDVSFPSKKIACIGRSVEEMLARYDTILSGTKDSPAENISAETTKSNSPDSSVYDWLSCGENEIRFSAVAPQSFLTVLTGANLNFKLVYVRGKMVNDPKNDFQYLMDLEFEFVDKKFVPAAKGALSLVFGLTDSNVILETPTHLAVTHIKIEKNALYKILVL